MSSVLKSQKENKQKSAKQNYIYNLIYQVFALLTPLVVTPYISRVLGSSGVGQYAFTYSIITYFILFAAFGFGYYAQREVARYQGDKHNQTKVFYEILIARSITVFLSCLIHIFIIALGIYGASYSILMWILTINIVATAFDVTFLFQGNEEFGFIAFRNIIIKVVGAILIIALVKDSSHVWLYALLQSLILIGSNLSLWTRLPRYLSKVRLRELDIQKHFAPAMRLFIPTIAISVYTMLDKTLIGVLVPGTTIVDGAEKSIADIENGFYDNSEKMVKMAITIVTSLGTVMIPKNSFAIANGDTEGFKNNILKALRFTFFLGVPIMFGIAAVAFNFSPWFFGEGFEKVPYLMALISPLTIIIGLSNVLGLQYFLPQKKDRVFTIAITSGAVLNIVMNLFLIHFYWSYGAALATLLAETAVTGIMIFFARKDISMMRMLKMSWKYILSGCLMFVTVYATQLFLPASILCTLILVAEGIGIYFTSLFILHDTWFLAQIKSTIRKVFRK